MHIIKFKNKLKAGYKMAINSVYIEINDFCNNKCIYCYNNKKAKNYISVNQFEIIIKKFIDLGISNVILSGGEPTIHPQFIEIINLLNDLNVNFGLSTNGLAINQQMIDIFKQSHSFVQVSLDTINPELYKTIRKSDNLDIVINNISNLLDNGIDTTVSIVLTQLSIDSLEDTIRFLSNLGVSTIHVDEVKKVGFARDDYEKLFIKDFYNVLEKLYKLQKDLYPKTSIDLIEGILIRSLKDSSEFAHCNSMNGNLLQIDCDGNVYRCRCVGEILRIGNIYKEDISQVVLKASESNFCLSPNQLECKECDAKNICRGHCRAQTYSNTNNLLSKSPRCEEIHNFILKVIEEKNNGLINDLLFETELSYEYNIMNGFAKWV